MIYETNYHAGFCNENNRKRHDFKTSQWQVFENVFGKSFQAASSFAFFRCASKWILIPAIMAKKE